MTKLLEQAIAQIKQLPETEQDRIARFILNALENNLVEKSLSIIDESDTWTEEDQLDITSFSLDKEMTNTTKTVVITKEILDKGCSINGGYSRKQLELFGIQGFPPGWKKALLGKVFSVEVVNQFIALQDQHLKS
ncbi:hypothetical protein [Anabaena catenula]|uniref:hypothetical protein n=1 Tax=Anabaena catenula TaxID=1296320 RepID=UPI001F54CDC0|nr:hypothetical protein [Anabaena catenula]